MGHSNGRITAPVNTDDVAATIGQSSSDVAALCLSNKINKWAKYKPEGTGTMQTLTLTLRQRNNFGLVPSVKYQGINDFISELEHGTYNGGWTYIKPNANQWKRLDDFVGYNHNATSPFGHITAGGYLLTNANDVTIAAPMPSGSDTDGLIDLADMQNTDLNISAFYFGVLLYGNHILYATAENTVGNHDWNVHFENIPSSFADYYIAVPFLSSKKLTYGAALPSGVVIVGTGQEGVDVSISTIEAYYKYFISAYYTSSTSTGIKYTATITNPSDKAVVFSSVKLSFATTVTGTSSITPITESNVTVQPKSTWTKKGTYAALQHPNGYYKFAQLSTTSLSGSTGWRNFMISGGDIPET